MSQEEQNQAFNIEITEEVAEGVYSNLAMVMHSHSEFVLDFVRLVPGHQSAKVKSRIILSPDNVKRLMRMLQHNVYTFEQENGVINLPEDVQSPEGFPQGGEA